MTFSSARLQRPHCQINRYSPVKCRIEASFLLVPSFKISSALNPCSLYISACNYTLHSSQTHSSTECARRGLERASGAGVAIPRTPIAAARAATGRVGSRATSGRRLRIISSQWTSSALCPMSSSQRGMNKSKCTCTHRDLGWQRRKQMQVYSQSDAANSATLCLYVSASHDEADRMHWFPTQDADANRLAWLPSKLA